MAKKQKNFFDITKARQIGKKVVKNAPASIPAPQVNIDLPKVEEQQISNIPVKKAAKKKAVKAKTINKPSTNTSAEKRHQKFRERKSYIYLDRVLLDKAKKHAAENGTSVSFLVEKYLKKLTSNND